MSGPLYRHSPICGASIAQRPRGLKPAALPHVPIPWRGLALAILVLAGSTWADVGPPVKIRMPVDTKAAKSGRSFTGVFEIDVRAAGVVSDIEITGAGWTIHQVDKPNSAKQLDKGVFRIPFTATPTNAEEMITLSLHFDGRKAVRSLRVGPEAMAARGKDRAVIQQAPVTRHPREDDRPRNKGGATTLHFEGRIVYDRPVALDEDYNPILGTTVEGVDSIWVQVMDEDPVSDEVIWEGLTDADGYFDSGNVQWDDCDVGCDDPDIYLRFETDNAIVNVQDNNDITEPDFSWSTEANVINDFTGSAVNFGTVTPADSMGMIPLHIHNSIIRAHRFILYKSGTGLATPELDVLWPEDDDTSFYVKALDEMHITASAQWRESTHSHEYGHHFLSNFAITTIDSDYCNGLCDGDDCGHCVWCEETDHDAWNEGFPNWLADIITRDYPFTYTRSDGNPLYALDDFDFDFIGECGEGAQFSDPLRTEGYLQALLRDIEDGVDFNGDSLQDTHDGNDPWVFRDCLALGYDEIFDVALSEIVISPDVFIGAFLSLYPEHTPAFYQTARNVSSVYSDLFPTDTEPPGKVQTVTAFRHDTAHPFPCIWVSWEPPPDDVTGACAYDVEWGTDPAGIEPGMVEDVIRGCPVSEFGPFDLGAHYISIRARDCADHWSSEWETFGPFVVDDCNDNGIVDVCETRCSWAWAPCYLTDFCQAQPDCGFAPDCNDNLAPDDCDIANGTSEDCNLDGVPDECELLLSTWAGGSGSWHDFGKWTNGIPPSNAYDACIDDPDSDATVTFSQGSVNITILACNENFEYIGGGSSPQDLTLIEPSWINGTLTMHGGAGELTVSDQLDLNGPFDWTGSNNSNHADLTGFGETHVNGGMTLTSGCHLQDHTLIIDNNSTAVASGRLFFDGVSQLTVTPGATYNYTGPQYIFTGLADDLFVNQGTFIKSADSGNGQIGIPMQNDGLVHVQSGTFSIRSGSTSNGDYLLDPGTVLEIYCGAHQFLPSSSIVGERVVFEGGGCGATNIRGTYNVTDSTSQFSTMMVTFASDANIVNYGSDLINEGRITVNAVTGGPVQFDELTTGELTWNSSDPIVTNTATITDAFTIPPLLTVNGLMTWHASSSFIGPGAIDALGGVMFAGGNALKTLDDVTLNNAGTFVSTKQFALSNGSVVNNLPTGVFDIQVDGGVTGLSTSGLFNNSGTVVKSAGAGTSTFATHFTNSGNLHVETGTLAFSGDFGLTFVQTAGETVLAGGNLAATGNLAFNIQGGDLSGAGNIAGRVINGGGTVSPGSSFGTIQTTGNYSQGGNGTLDIEIEGLTPDTDHDVLAVGGTATLGGMLAVETVNFEPQIGQSFTILTAATVSQTFSTVNPQVWNVTYNTNSVVLTYVGPGCGTFAATDLDADCDVDAADVSMLIACTSGPAMPLTPGCEPADLDNDVDVDLTDFALMQACISGPNTPPSDECLD